MEKLELKPALVIFDLDGTLINSSDQIYHSVIKAREMLGLKLINKEDLVPKIGLHAKELFFDLNLTDPEKATAIHTFRKNLLEYALSSNDLYLKTIDLLETLTKQSIKLAVATNKPKPLAKLALEQSGILEFFGCIVGGELLPPKPSPLILLECLKLSQTSRERSLMIGDRIEDMSAAKNIGMKAYGVLQGIHGSKELLEAGAYRTFDSIAELHRHMHKGEVI